MSASSSLVNIFVTVLELNMKEKIVKYSEMNAKNQKDSQMMSIMDMITISIQKIVLSMKKEIVPSTEKRQKSKKILRTKNVLILLKMVSDVFHIMLARVVKLLPLVQVFSAREHLHFFNLWIVNVLLAKMDGRFAADFLNG